MRIQIKKHICKLLAVVRKCVWARYELSHLKQLKDNTVKSCPSNYFEYFCC